MGNVTTTTARKTLGSQVKRGISWNVLSLVINKGTSVVVRLVLARLLIPEQFGLVAMIVVCTGLASTFVDAGLHNALVQRARDKDSLLRCDTAFWFLAASGFAWTVAFIVGGIPLMIWFYGEPRLASLAIVMSLTIFVQSLTILPQVRLTRRMRFKEIVSSEIISMVLASALAVGMAFLGAGAWSLAAQQLVSVSARSALLWKFARWRPRWRFSFRSLWDVANFSMYMLGSKLVYYLRTNIDNFVVGAMLGAASLGVYSIAFAFSEGLRQQVASIIDRIMFPAYSRMQNDLEELQKSYLRVTRFMSLIVFPFSLILAVNAEWIVVAGFGIEWSDAAMPMRILAFGAIVFAGMGPSAEVLQAIGRADVLFRIAAVNLMLVALPSVIALTYFAGVPGAALAFVVTFSVQRFLSGVAAMGLLSLRFRDLLRVHTSVAAAGAVSLIAFFLTENVSGWIGVMLFSAATLIAFLGAAVVFLKRQNSLWVKQ